MAVAVARMRGAARPLRHREHGPEIHVVEHRRDHQERERRRTKVCMNAKKIERHRQRQRRAPAARINTRVCGAKPVAEKAAEERAERRGDASDDAERVGGLG